MADLGTFASPKEIAHVVESSETLVFGYSGSEEWHLGTFSPAFELATGGPCPPCPECPECPEPCPPPSNNAAGDWLTRFVADDDAPIVRTTVYTVAGTSRIVVRGFSVTNTASVDRTFTLWLSGVPVLNGISIPPAATITEESLWVLYPGELMEVQASATGVAVLISGVEVVS